jgi:transposase
VWAANAAKLIGEIAGTDRFASDSKLARTGGAAPAPALSGNTVRQRLDPGGNRQLNYAFLPRRQQGHMGPRGRVQRLL